MVRDTLMKKVFSRVCLLGKKLEQNLGNSPGRLTYKVITESATLNRILGSKIDLLASLLYFTVTRNHKNSYL